MNVSISQAFETELIFLVLSPNIEFFTTFVIEYLFIRIYSLNFVGYQF